MKQPTNTLLDNERALLGARMMDPEATNKEVGDMGINSEWFDNSENATVSETMDRMTAQGKQIDPVTVKEETGYSGEIIQRYVDAVTVAGHQRSHALPLQARYFDRQAIKILKRAKGNPTDILHALDQITALLPAGGMITALQASKWLQELDEEERPIVGDLIDRCGRVAIVGQSKARKSFYAMQLAITLATGRDFLGYTVYPKRVLLINGEIGATFYKRRLRRMINALKVEGNSLDRLMVVNSSEDASPWNLERILTLSKSAKAEVVVVDPFYLLIEDELDQGLVRQCVREMKKFSQAGITIMMVFHATKGRIGDKQTIDRISGSGIFARDCSTLISLCEHATEQEHIVMSCEVRNHPPQPPMTLHFTDGAFTVARNVSAIEKTSSTKPTRKFDLEAVAQCIDKPMTYGQAVSAIKQSQAIGDNKAKELLSEMVVKDHIKKEIDGTKVYYRFNEV